MRFRRAYFTLTAGLLTGFLLGISKQTASFVYAGVFLLSYIGFLPVLLLLGQRFTSKKHKLAIEIVLWCTITAIAVAFVCYVPVHYAIALTA